MYSKREIIEMCYRPQNTEQSILDKVVDSILNSWSEEKILTYFSAQTGAKLMKIGSQFAISF